MTQMMKSLGIVVLGLSLLALTSGCGKKMVRGAAGTDHRVARASLKDSPNSLSRLSGFPEDSRRMDDDPYSTSNGGGKGSLSTNEKGMTSFGEEPGLEILEESADGAIFTTPASSVGSLTDTSFASAGGSLSDRRLGDSVQAGPGQASQKGVTFSKGLQDIYFQFDSWRLTEDARKTLEANAQWLKSHPHERIIIEGHCDERGTQAYNYVLGEKRATMVHQYLGFLGVDHRQLVVTSFGKDKPKCHSFSEACFQENRRAHFGSDLNVARQ